MYLVAREAFTRNLHLRWNLGHFLTRAFPRHGFNLENDDQRGTSISTVTTSVDRVRPTIMARV